MHVASLARLDTGISFATEATGAPAVEPSKRRENNFDFLRLFLAVLVIFSHCYPLAIGTETNEPFVRLTHGQATGGAIAVDLFFIMSGYLITASFLRSEGIRDFLSKRVRRIYPGFTIAMLFGALVIIPLSGGAIRATRAGSLINFVGNALLLREPLYAGTFSHNPLPNMVNGAVWTIPFEFWCYIGVLMLGMSGMLSRRKLMSGIFICAVAFSVWFNVLHLEMPLARLLPMYLAGVIAYLFRDIIHYNRTHALICFFALLFACFVPLTLGAILPFAAAYLLFWIAFNPSFRLHRAAKFGDFSYGTYLYAFPVQQMIVKTWGRPMSPFVLFLLAVPATLAFAIASWHFVERPFLNMRRKPDLSRSADAAQIMPNPA
jgi:peptidoglycan/LPS O-acetylase OafA/YrhL